MKTKKRKKVKKVVKKIVKKEKCNCGGRMPSNKSKENKVAKLKKLAASRKNKKHLQKEQNKGFFGWFKK